MLNRRSLLKLGALGALAATAGVTLPRALAGGRARRLVVLFAYGGWDPTYVFDPSPDSPGVDTPAGDWMTYGDLDLWDSGRAPNVRAFFDRWSSQTAVINGHAVDSLVHEECLKRVLTGTSSPAADIGARVAAAGGEERPLPYLLLGGTARTTGLEAKSGRAGWTNQLSQLALPETYGWPAPGGRGPSPGLQPQGADDDAVTEYLRRRGGDLLGRGNTADDQRASDYLESLGRATAIREGAARGWLADPTLFGSADPWARTAAALSEGFSQAVFIDDGAFWDTHVGNSAQAGLFNDLFGGLDRLLSELWAADILDETVVLVVSEMGRTPLLNPDGGKDHWPFTSAMLVGAGVRNATVRGTDEDLRPVRIDPVTGAPDPGGHRLSAQDVLATTAALCGLDPQALYPDGEVLDAVMA